MQRTAPAPSPASTAWIVIPLGVLCGIALTVMVHDLWAVARASSQQIAVTQRTEPSASAVTGHVGRLRREKQELLDRLQRVEAELSKLVSLPHPSPATAAVPAKQRSDCKYGFTVYVYRIPPSSSVLRISEEARRNGTLHVCKKCILEQFALEYIVYDFFTSFCGRTDDPETADYLYLPLVRDAEFRFAMQTNGARFRTPSAVEEVLLEAMEKNSTSRWTEVLGVTDRYWHRRGGADHVLVMPAPVTNFRHETGQRGFFHYMTHLHSPVFLHLEYSKQFVAEYPACAVTKNIMLPYPTTDPDLFSGKLLPADVPRTDLLYYAGGMHGECVEVRQALRHLLTNSSHLQHVVPKARSNQEEREMGFLQARYCPIPIGDSPSSKRMYDVLNFGCVPVVLSDDLLWALSLPVGGPLNHSQFSIQIPQSVVHYTAQRSLRVYKDHREGMGVLPSGVRVYDLLEQSLRQGGDREAGLFVNPLVQILRLVPEGDYKFLQKNGKWAGSQYRYYAINASMQGIPTAVHLPPDGGAIDLLASALQARVDHGLTAIAAQCAEEKSRPHGYVRGYSCDGKDKVDSLLPPSPPSKPRGKGRGKK